MADTKISALTASSAVTGSEDVPVNDAGTNKRITPNQIIAYLLSAARVFAGKLTLSGGYEESGSTLTQSAGSLTIPVDGKTYAFMPSQAITAITTTLPTAPACSGCTVYVTQGATGYAVAYPAAWRWPNGMATLISTVANSVTRLVLMTDPAGNVHADAEVRSVV